MSRYCFTNFTSLVKFENIEMITMAFDKSSFIIIPKDDSGILEYVVFYNVIKNQTQLNTYLNSELQKATVIEDMVDHLLLPHMKDFIAFLFQFHESWNIGKKEHAKYLYDQYKVTEKGHNIKGEMEHMSPYDLHEIAAEMIDRE